VSAVLSLLDGSLVRRINLWRGLREGCICICICYVMLYYQNDYVGLEVNE
jgi:hypothetical protein